MKDIVIEEPYTEKKRKIVYNPNILLTRDNYDAGIQRIVQEEEFTRIDFVYRASPKYINGGWVQIDRETFIRPSLTGIRLTLVQAVNIPVSPKKRWFKKVGEYLYYTLYFPKLPDDVVAIDIIEREAARPHNFFNFYGVSLEKIAGEIIIVNN